MKIFQKIKVLKLKTVFRNLSNKIFNPVAVFIENNVITFVCGQFINRILYLYILFLTNLFSSLRYGLNINT